MGGSGVSQRPKYPASIPRNFGAVMAGKKFAAAGGQNPLGAWLFVKNVLQEFLIANATGSGNFGHGREWLRLSGTLAGNAIVRRPDSSSGLMAMLVGNPISRPAKPNLTGVYSPDETCHCVLRFINFGFKSNSLPAIRPEARG
jgi:hypothetical protein